MSIFASCVDTDVGNFYMLIDENDTVVKSAFGTTPKNFKTKSHAYQKLVQAYLNGDSLALSKIKYRQSSTNFSEEVWQAISAIPFGQTQTYQQIGSKTSSPKALRAVGTACGRNNICLIVPCHRVVKGNGSPGKYAFGTEIKKFLLNLETHPV